MPRGFADVTPPGPRPPLGSRPGCLCVAVTQGVSRQCRGLLGISPQLTLFTFGGFVSTRLLTERLYAGLLGNGEGKVTELVSAW